MVRFLRTRSSSERGPPPPKRSSYFWNWMRFAPNACRFPITLLLKPVTIATIAMTVVTPTTMPSVVRPERSLWSRIALRAKRTVLRVPFMALLPANRFHGRQLGGGGRGGEAREDAGDRRDDEPDDDELEADLRGEDLADGERNEGASQNADRPSDR